MRGERARGRRGSANMIVTWRSARSRSVSTRVDVDQPAGADDADAVGDVLHLVERVRREEDGAAVGGGLAQQRPELGLEQRVEPARRLVEDSELGPVHERLHERRSSAGCPSRARRIGRSSTTPKPLAERVAERRVDRAA